MSRFPPLIVVIFNMIEVSLRFWLFLLLSILICMNGSSSLQNNVEVRYYLRTINATAFGPSNEPIIVEFKSTTQNFTQYFSSTFKIIRTFIARRIFLQIERCRESEIGCETFQTWNFTRFCRSVMMKNQIWTPLVSSITPNTLFQNCPRISEGVYKFDNVSVDLDPIIKFYDEAPKYYWKVRGWYYNQRSEIESRGYVHAFFTKYKKRVRTKVRNENEW